MGKKQGKTKGKFDNVEISRPLLSAEMIKAIHTPPNQKQKEGGFKALFADSGSQDLLNDLPAVSQHLPSYVGISCAISGYTNYSPYLKSARSGHNSPSNTNNNTNNADGAAKSVTNPPSMTSSPLIGTKTNHPTQTVDNIRSNQLSSNKHNLAYSTNDTNGRLTPNITGSDSKRAPSPSISRMEDDRHHGTCVGARYCLLPAPDKSYNKHIPLLGIDDDKVTEGTDENETEANKSVQKRIASLYGDQFAEGWKESNSHKARRDVDENSVVKEKMTINPKDLVKLKPTPTETKLEPDDLNHVTLPDTTTLSKAPVFAGVEKQFLGQLLSNGVSIKPTSQLPRIINSHKTSRVAGQLTDSCTQEQSFGEVQMLEEVANIKSEEDNPSSSINDLPITNCKLITDTKQEPKMDISDTVASLESRREEDDLNKDKSPLDEQCLLNLDGEGEPGKISALDGNTQKDTSHNYKNDLLSISENIKHEIENGSSTDACSLKPVSDQSQALEEIISNGNKVVTEVNNDKLIEFDQSISSVSKHQESHETQEETKENLEETSEIKDESIETEKKKADDATSRDGRYFLEQLRMKSDLILNNVERAEIILRDEGDSLDEENLGKIHSAIGKANLLLNKKCKQFEGLCANNLDIESKDEKYATLNDDLEGFWDMIVIQLNECEEAFKQLWIAQNNGWKSDDNQLRESGPSTRSTQPSKLPKLKLNAQKDQERRDRLQEHIDNLKKQQQEAAKQRRKNSNSQSPELQDFISGEAPADLEELSQEDEKN